jgi:DNA-binding FadR family transcriptional regulator
MSDRPTLDTAPGANPGFRRIAEQVADLLRARILSGEIPDGGLLPKEDVLQDAYQVSKPSLREAMRILEAEGLVTVRRGNAGGAIVHHPSPANVGYSLAMVLTSREIGIADVAQALREVEPACARLCAQRPDRLTAVVPRLTEIHERSLATLDDLVEVTEHSRAFHEAIVERCGNETLKIMAGALEALWSSHEKAWAEHHPEPASLPLEERRAALLVHGRLIELIAAGDSAAAGELAADHLRSAQTYPSTSGPLISPVLVRELRAGG